MLGTMDLVGFFDVLGLKPGSYRDSWELNFQLVDMYGNTQEQTRAIAFLNCLVSQPRLWALFQLVLDWKEISSNFKSSSKICQKLRDALLEWNEWVAENKLNNGNKDLDFIFNQLQDGVLRINFEDVANPQCDEESSLGIVLTRNYQREALNAFVDFIPDIISCYVAHQVSKKVEEKTQKFLPLAIMTKFLENLKTIINNSDQKHELSSGSRDLQFLENLLELLAECKTLEFAIYRDIKTESEAQDAFLRLIILKMTGVLMALTKGEEVLGLDNADIQEENKGSDSSVDIPRVVPKFLFSFRSSAPPTVPVRGFVNSNPPPRPNTVTPRVPSASAIFSASYKRGESSSSETEAKDNLEGDFNEHEIFEI